MFNSNLTYLFTFENIFTILLNKINNLTPCKNKNYLDSINLKKNPTKCNVKKN